LAANEKWDTKNKTIRKEIMQRSNVTFKLSAQMLSHIEWCKNPDNMPVIQSGSEDKVDPIFICPASRKLPVVPVDIFGEIYDLDAVSSVLDNETRILRLHEEIRNNIPLADPKNDIVPASSAIRDNISAIRKELAKQAPRQANPAALYQAKPQAEVAKPAALSVEDEFNAQKMAIKAIKEDRVHAAEELRLKYNLNIDHLAEEAALYGRKYYAEQLLKHGAKLQSVANGAAMGNDIKYVEELMIRSNMKLDFSLILVSAYRGDVYNDDKSCMRFLSGIQNPNLQNGICLMFKQIAPHLSFFNIGVTFKDFDQRLRSVYGQMYDRNTYNGYNRKMDFDAAYETMTRQFDQPVSRPGYY
jgi:hypothetical protein